MGVNKMRKIFCSLVLLGTMILCNVGMVKANSSVLNGAVEWHGHYYKVFAMPLTWKKAYELCQKMGGHLATAETKEENEKIKEIYLNGEDNKGWCWIGGERKGNGIWSWITGKTMVEYFDWVNGKPRENLQLGGPYLSMWGRYDGKWDNLGKREKKIFMCEWETAEDAHEVGW